MSKSSSERIENWLDQVSGVSRSAIILASELSSSAPTSHQSRAGIRGKRTRSSSSPGVSPAKRRREEGGDSSQRASIASVSEPKLRPTTSTASRSSSPARDIFKEYWRLIPQAWMRYLSLPSIILMYPSLHWVPYGIQRRYDPLVKPCMGLVPNSLWGSAPQSVPGYWYGDTSFKLGLLLLILTICWLPSSKGPRTRWKHFMNDVDEISSRDPGNIYYSNQVVLSKKAMLGVWMSSLFFL